MLKKSLCEDSRMFNDIKSSKVFLVSDDDSYQSGIRYKFGLSDLNPFSNMWSGKVHPNMSHNVWFNNYFESSKVFSYNSESWEWVLESILIGPNWNKDREQYT
jgi:hypothetical protein